jgi:hypothetical protein
MKLIVLTIALILLIILGVIVNPFATAIGIVIAMTWRKVKP